MVAEVRPDGEPYDSREVVADRLLDEVPFSAIGYILVDLQSGARQRGTGFLIDPRVVLTAAHVLHTQEGDRATLVTFTPSCRIANPPSSAPVHISQSIGRDRYRVSKAWEDGDRSISADYGAIFLANASIFVACNKLSVAPVQDTFVVRHVMEGTADFIVAGFPVDKPNGTQWFGRGQLLASPTHSLNHTVDTIAGESGAPLLAAVVDPTSKKKVPMALGIHSRAAENSLNYNEARTIDASLLADLKRWNDEIAALPR
jgi:V8-like Glu-specific endopeptidase